MARTRNPTWTRDELILALDLYLSHRKRLPAKSDPAVEDLSKQLLRLSERIHPGSENFRNPNGVYMKLNNFRAVDPEYTAEGKVGLARGGKGDAAIWSEYADDPATLKEVANAIRTALKGFGGERPDHRQAADEFVEAKEGRLLTRLHYSRERNAQIVERKKQAVYADTGALCCEACGFDYSVNYGSRGEGFIEVHHIRPVVELVGETTTRLTDLAVLCANCHRMIHRAKPWLGVEELKNLVEMNRGR